MSLLDHYAAREGSTDQRHELEGICAIFRNRMAADLAVEHLAQEYGVDPAFIYVEPLDEENSAGVEASGGDAACAAPGHGRRPDAPLHGAIQVNLPVRRENLAIVCKALEDVGATQIEIF